jgi:EmrB/QacA subfamily drug resistance transporter
MMAETDHTSDISDWANSTGSRAEMPVKKGGVLALALICSAQFVLQLDFSIVNVALPTIQRDLNMAAAQLQWIVTGYALTFGSLLLVGGRLADIAGRRRLLRLGLVLFALASLACGLAQWPVMLIMARIIQGSAGAMVSPSALSLLTTSNPEGPLRNRALALWQATTAAGATAGIIAGGLLTEFLGWRAIFLVNPPLIAVMLALSGKLPRRSGVESGGVDVRGASLITAAIAALIFGLSSGDQHGFASPTTLVAMSLAVVCGGGFVHSQAHRSRPMIPKGFFSSGTRRGAVISMVLIGAILAGYVYFTSLYLQRVAHFSPVATGLAMLPSTLMVVLVSTLMTRRLLVRFSVKSVLLTALTSITAGQLVMTQVSASPSYANVVLPGLLLTALGIGLGLPTISIAVTSGVEGHAQGVAGALFTTSQQTGAAVGLAVLATVAASYTAHGMGSLVQGYRLAFLVAAGFGGVAWIIAATQLKSAACQRELSRQAKTGGGVTTMAPAEAAVRRA